MVFTKSADYLFHAYIRAFLGKCCENEGFNTEISVRREMGGDVSPGKVCLSLVAHESEFVAETEDKLYLRAAKTLIQI